ncbi:hypothetical protein PUNSTDRAFT_125169 [Punctularia strigosozonata HHB-11173 SS5]|uniref:uncharacterized protein n=1 Tax=Punctularia strigosozonata (strain HHB-11173) TaxID=741275 RepID=UPI000441848B|nr:uncharacterized protein PUNSTDRAFT_125169 [Punctularia strigosozonata HHB-11173 SS5]EIN10203.1 hypothetical protein PUNSTDRAFT_125169 [Punctularia strigosozonata HHB-11173 SS5]
MANRIVPSAFHIIHLLGVIFGAHTVTKLMVNHPLLPAAFYNYLSTWENVIAEIALGRSTGEHATLSAVTAVYKTFQFTADLLGAPLDALRSWASLVHRLSATERQAEENPRCFGPGCPETEALLERKLQVCGGCNHMKYCSKECQRQAWKDQIVPHKPICKLIQGLRARGVREPVWAGENIVQAVASMAELYPVFQALADHIDQLAA